MSGDLYGFGELRRVRSNTSLERTRPPSSAKPERRRTRRSAQSLGLLPGSIVTAIGNFRSAFRQHLGEERYRKFLGQGSRPRRRFWQDEALAQFFTAHPEHRLSGEQLESALRICEIHDVDLQPVTAVIFEGCLDYSQEYLDERASQFPHACLDPISTEGGSVSAVNTSVWYCSVCRDVQQRHAKWRPNTSLERTRGR